MRFDTAAAVLILSLAGYIFIEARGLPFGTLRAPQSAFFPIVLAALLAILAVLLAFKARSAPKAGNQAHAVDLSQDWARAGAALASLCVFALVLEALGFLLSAFLLMAVLLRAVEARRWPNIFLIALVAALFSYVVFSKVLGLPLPAGLLGF